jgi:hypothetical protein
VMVENRRYFRRAFGVIGYLVLTLRRAV